MGEEQKTGSPSLCTSDNLIMGTKSMRPMGKLIESPIQLVSGTIIPEAGNWNSDLIQHVFLLQMLGDISNAKA